MKKKFDLSLTDQELNILLFSLQKQPYEVVNDLIRNLVAQIQMQQKESATDNNKE